MKHAGMQRFASIDVQLCDTISCMNYAVPDGNRLLASGRSETKRVPVDRTALMPGGGPSVTSHRDIVVVNK